MRAHSPAPARRAFLYKVLKQSLLHEVVAVLVHCVLTLLLIEVVLFALGYEPHAMAKTTRDASVHQDSANAQERWVLREPERASALIAGRDEVREARRFGVGKESVSVRLWRVDAPWDARDPHACVYVEVQDAVLPHDPAAAPSFTFAPNASVLLRVGARPDCGWLEDARVRSVPIAFESGGHTGRLSLPYVLRNESHMPEGVALTVQAGGGVTHGMLRGEKQSADALEYQFSLEIERSTPPLPSCVHVRWDAQDAVQDGRVLRRNIGGSSAWYEHAIRVTAESSCAPGTYQIPLRVASVMSQHLQVPDEIRVVDIEVQPAQRVRFFWIGTVCILVLIAAAVFRFRRRTIARQRVKP